MERETALETSCTKDNTHEGVTSGDKDPAKTTKEFKGRELCS